MQVDTRNPRDLIPYYQNAKPHKIKLRVLQQSIQRFGFDQPIVVDEEGVILKGHGRRLASIALNLKEVPVIIKTGLSEKQKKIIRISDNKIFEKSSIDEERVKSELDDMMADGVEGMSEFFDMSHYDLGGQPPQDKDKPKDKGGSGSPVTGKLVQCPKCGAAQWEDE